MIGKNSVDFTSNKTWLDSNDAAISLHLEISKVFTSVTNLEQHAVGDGLSRKGGTGCAESNWDTKLLGNREDAFDFLFVVDFDDHFGVEAVEGGVCAVGKCAYGICELTVLGDEICKR